MARWWNGRHAGLKIPCSQGREGSIPSLATKRNLVRGAQDLPAACLPVGRAGRLKIVWGNP